jgi:hypothetical protein
MAKSKFDTSFSFGALEGSKAGKPAASSGKKGGRKKLSAAQKATAHFYIGRKR